MDETQQVVRAKSVANQLRRLADMIDQHPIEMHLSERCFVFDVWVDAKEDLARFARAVRKVKKTFGEGWVEFEWKIGDDVKYRMNIHRGAVCKAVETGEEEYVPERVTPAYTIKKTKWVCDDPAFLPPNKSEDK
jgi:hypothetical protein